MKLIKLIMMFVTLSSITYSQEKNNLLTITIDGSRLIEDSSNYDSGLDISGTFVMLRENRLRPLIKFEAFPNLQFYKTSIGAEYSVPIFNKYRDLLIELSIGGEVGMISRSTSEYEAYFGYVTYGFNGDIRLFKPLKRFPIIISYNEQWRSDMDIWNAESKFVGSLFIGLGYSF